MKKPNVGSRDREEGVVSIKKACRRGRLWFSINNKEMRAISVGLEALR